MSNIDISSKQYFHNQYVVSDLLGVTFENTNVDPEQIQFIDADSSYSEEAFHRDLLTLTSLFEYEDSHVSIVGLEPQSYIDYSLPIRSMVYDAMEYDKQRKDFIHMHKEKKDLPDEEFLSGISKDDQFKNVVTIVIWLGTETYEGPVRLSELMHRSETEQRNLPDYGFILVDAHQMTDEEINACQTDLRELLFAIKYASSKEELEAIIQNHEVFRNVTKECAQLIKDALNLDVIIEAGKDGTIDMCKAVEEMKKVEFMNGEQHGFQRGDLHGYKRGVTDGFTEGETSAAKKIAIKLLQSGMEPEMVTKMTGVDGSVLKTLKS